MIGQKFTRATVIEIVTCNKWKCQCDCGKIFYTRGRNLKSGKTKSCGCYCKDIRSKDLINKVFGQLTVVEKTLQRKGRYVVWKCICTCGNESYCRTGHLTGGNVSSCGCLRKDVTLLNDKKQYDLVGKKFYRWHVIEQLKERKGKAIRWKSRCECGNIGYQTTSDLLNGRSRSCGCYVAVKSKGERLIESYLINNNVFYQMQVRFNDCKNKSLLPFDFCVYINERKLLIEYHGIQHYTSLNRWGGEQEFRLRKKRDKIKFKYCKNNSIPLLVIPYWEQENIKQLITEFIKE